MSVGAETQRALLRVANEPARLPLGSERGVAFQTSWWEPGCSNYLPRGVNESRDLPAVGGEEGAARTRRVFSQRWLISSLVVLRLG